MRRESGVKGLKLTRGVCCLLLLSGIDFPEASTFLKRATLRLEEPVLLPLARDRRLWKGRSDSEAPTKANKQTNKQSISNRGSRREVRGAGLQRNAVKRSQTCPGHENRSPQ